MKHKEKYIVWKNIPKKIYIENTPPKSLPKLSKKPPNKPQKLYEKQSKTFQKNPPTMFPIQECNGKQS